MMRIWVVMGVLLVACADDDAVQGPRDQRDAAVSDQFSGTVDVDVGQGNQDMFATEDIYVPSSPTQDVNRPIWPEGAALAIERRGSEIEVRWPEASDDQSIGGYSVHVDGALKSRTRASERMALLSSLTSSLTYEIAVVASDDAMNRSTPLSTRYEHLDQEPPTWPSSSEIIITPLSDTSVIVSWTAAVDNVGVVAYDIALNGEASTRVEMSTRHTFEGLSPRTRYTVSIRALDAVGLETPDTLTLDFETSDQIGPTWAETAALSATQSGNASVLLSWSAAEDDSDQTYYRIEADGVVVAEVTDTSWEWTGVQTPNTYAFSVRAMDSGGALSTRALTATLEVTDRTPPTWRDGDVGRALTVGATSVELDWPSASDNDRVLRYVVRWGEQTRRTDVPNLRIEGLVALVDYRFEIHAVDASANQTERPLVVDVTTVDEIAPFWAPGAALSLNWTDEGRLDVNWPEAQDDVGIIGYSISVNTSEPIVLGNVTHYSLSALLAGQDYVIRVTGYDATGKQTRTPLQGTARRANEAAPEWPQGASLLVSNLTETSLRLGWPPAIGSGMNHTYALSWDGGSEVTSSTSLEIEGLSPWVDYTFTLSVTDAAGIRGATDLTRQVRTLDVTPPEFSGADALSALEIGEDFLDLQWSPATDNVAVVRYTIYVNGVLHQVVSGEQNRLLIDGLMPWREYFVEVHAEDEADNRTVMAAQLSVRTLDETAPWWPEVAVVGVESLTPTGVTVTWPEAQDNVGIVGYIVQVDNEEPRQLLPSDRGLRVSNLLPWQTYRIQIYAQDAAGLTSLPLEVDVSTPDTEAPRWPLGAGIIVDGIESTTLDIRWPDASDDVAVVTYEVSADGVKMGETNTGSLSFRLAGLQPAHLVLVQIAAKDAAGNESVRLGLSVETPDGGPPTWMDNTLQWQTGLNHATLDWVPAQDDVLVTGYRVIIDGNVKFETTDTHALIEGLVPGDSYSVRIDAGDAANNWSANGPAATVTTVERAYEGFRRLSKLEYARAVANLWQWVYGTDENPRLYCDHNQPETRVSYCKNAPDGFDGWIKILDGDSGPWVGKGLLGSYPEEQAVRGEHELGGGFERLDQRLFDEHVGVWALVAGSLTQHYVDRMEDRRLGRTPWGQAEGAASLVQWQRCEDELGDPAAHPDGLLAFTRLCFARFVETFSSRAIRRMPTDDERAVFMGYFDAVPDEMPEALESERQRLCWLNVKQPRWANPQPVPWVWATGDEDFCAQVDPAEIDTIYPTTMHLEQGMVAFIPVVMSAPEFLYHVEVGDEQGGLTAHELANRLSFHFWKSPPDEALRDLASSGQLLDENIYEAQVERLFADPRAEESVRTFYNGYFWIDSVPNLYAGDVNYLKAHEDWYPGEYRGNPPSWYIEQAFFGPAAQAELSHLGHYFTREQPGSYREMFTSNLNFLECYREGFCGSAGIFGMFIYKTGNCSTVEECRDRGWAPDTETGYYPGDVPVEIPEANRFGLLTRIGFLMHETSKERPIRRGLKIRDMLLCDPIPPPENCDVVRVPQLTGLCAENGEQTSRECSHDSHCDEGQTCQDPFRKNRLTVREVVEEITEQEGTSCATCHARWINGMGHALNNYSSQGLFRPHEPLREEANVWSNQRWKLSVAMRPQAEWPTYNTQGAFQFEGEQYTVNGAEDLSNLLADSGRLESCWAQQYFRYTMGRLETASDVPLIESLADQLRNGASLATVFKGIALTETFKSISKPAPTRSSGELP